VAGLSETTAPPPGFAPSGRHERRTGRRRDRPRRRRLPQTSRVRMSCMVASGGVVLRRVRQDNNRPCPHQPGRSAPRRLRSRGPARAACTVRRRARCPRPGEARAATVAEARAGRQPRRLRPSSSRCCPDAAPRPTDVWLESLDASDGAPRVVAPSPASATGASASAARRRALSHEFSAGARAGARPDGAGWEPLPAIMKEGLCDAIACRAVPAIGRRARDAPVRGALRLRRPGAAADLRASRPSAAAPARAGGAVLRGLAAWRRSRRCPSRAAA
jgi:hypothetical protein